MRIKIETTIKNSNKTIVCHINGRAMMPYEASVTLVGAFGGNIFSQGTQGNTYRRFDGKEKTFSQPEETLSKEIIMQRIQAVRAWVRENDKNEVLEFDVPE
jgi:hypothetical protein